MKRLLTFLITTCLMIGITNGEKMFLDPWWKGIRQDLDMALAELQFLKRNPVPAGFIYVQFPNQSPPQDIWPQVAWNDVTAQYGGAFFRAEGTGSGKLGTVQAESVPKITALTAIEQYPVGTFPNTEIIDDDMNIIRIATRGSDPVASYYLGVITTGYDAEVRPKNYSVRIWIRVDS